METGRVIHGDSLEVLPELSENSVHAIVTDPPYGLAFMGRSWDDFEPREYQEWCENWARRARKCLRPGGHLLAFSGNRTHHRLFAGVEDAGFEVRDTITWHYGSGFPKALDVSKAIDKQADVDREVVGTREANDMRSGNFGQQDSVDDEKGGETMTYECTEPATDAAERWSGWKTHLKPATEYVVVARNPLGEDTVAGNVREWGTGALNIGDCRVGTETHSYKQDGVPQLTPRENDNTTGRDGASDHYRNRDVQEVEREGRYPSNVVFGERAAEQLDREVGDCPSGSGSGEGTTNSVYTNVSGPASDPDPDAGYEDTKQGPSRYFYTSKASKSERTLDGQIKNTHPTVKPIDLMEWLVRLTTAEGQVVLDPFAGSGTTLRAAKNLGREFVGIERNEEYADLARVRAGLPADDPSNVRADEHQAGLREF